MWVFHDADTRIVLLGSMHQLPPGLDWTGGRLAREIELAEELWLELAPEEGRAAANLYASLSRDEPVQPLATRLTEAQLTALRTQLAANSIAERDAATLESWALALMLGNANSHAEGMTPAAGVERILSDRFGESDKPIRGFETARQQLTMFDDLPAPAQDRMLGAVIDAQTEAPERTAQLLAAWAAGDVDALAVEAAEALADTPELIEPVLHRRNRAWAERLANRLDQPGSVLVAVGAGHLVGEGSVIALLRARGIRPIRLQ